MPPLSRRASRALLVAVVAVVCSVATALGGTDPTIEAGAYFDFVAPDPLAPAAGAIRFGFSGPVEVIAADATLVPPADTNLASLGGGTPTCLAVTREGGEITSIAFAEDCTVAGDVVLVPDLFGPGSGAYVIGDRVAAPQELADADPAFAAFIRAPADAGVPLAITFEVDPTIGVPIGFGGETEISGAVALQGNGDIIVGTATLPSAVIDDASRALLEQAAADGVTATVGIAGDGVLQQKGDPELVITLTVSLALPSVTPGTPAPTPAATQTALPDTRAEAPRAATPILGLGLAAASTAAVATMLARRRARARAPGRGRI